MFDKLNKKKIKLLNKVAQRFPDVVKEAYHISYSSGYVVVQGTYKKGDFAKIGKRFKDNSYYENSAVSFKHDDIDGAAVRFVFTDYDECNDGADNKIMCCHEGCDEEAEWEIVYGNSPDEVTQSCSNHVGHLLPSDAKEHRVYFIGQTENKEVWNDM